MLKHNLITALKFLRKNKVFAVINLLGLSIALAVSFIIILYVVNEFSYNRYHENRNNVYRVLNHYVDFNQIQTGTPYILAQTLKDEFPQVKEAVNTRRLRGFSIKSNDEFVGVRNAVGTSSGVFDIFTLPLISSMGTEGLLDNKYSICLSQSLAMMLFEDGDAVGKELTAIINNEEQILRITAVFKDIPENSSLRADCIVNGFWNIAPINATFEEDNAERNWARNFWDTWILLDEKTSSHDIENQFRDFEAKYHTPQSLKVNYSLQNLSDVYLNSDQIGSHLPKGNKKDIMIFLTLAFLIVVVAAINYIILSTAVSVSRTKEIGIRKTNGAKPGELRMQLLVESLMLTLMVLPIAVYLMLLGLPYAAELFQKEIHIIKGNIVYYALAYLVLTLFIGLASGLYTSTWLSKQNVLKVLKSPVVYGKNKSFFRAFLIILQLVIFCFFVSGTLIINAQYRFAMNKKPGFNNENVLFLNIGEDFKYYKPLLEEIRSNPNVISAAGALETLPITGKGMIVVPHTEDENNMVTVIMTEQDFDFLQTMGISLSKGRYFSESYGTDLQSACIINEAAVKQLGISQPLGHEIIEGYKVVGVVKDFYFESIHSEVQPLMILIDDEFNEQIAINYYPENLGFLLSQLEKSWGIFAPDIPFRYSLVEDLTSQLYKKEKSLIATASVSAVFTLIIAVMGLFGLTLFMARHRTKEIGIKKAMGSSALQIIYSFIRINILYVIIAMVVSTPVTLFVMEQWLRGYAERIEIGWWVFALTFAIASVVVVLTVLVHAFRAARVNPVESLRYE
ncbi:MAG: ABC transporter permease [Bacteroidetes bacterium]|nr:MAG: ABC transporter permease [Bacteroidota bacterium]